MISKNRLIQYSIIYSVFMLSIFLVYIISQTTFAVSKFVAPLDLKEFLKINRTASTLAKNASLLIQVPSETNQTLNDANMKADIAKQAANLSEDLSKLASQLSLFATANGNASISRPIAQEEGPVSSILSNQTAVLSNQFKILASMNSGSQAATIFGIGGLVAGLGGLAFAIINARQAKQEFVLDAKERHTNQIISTLKDVSELQNSLVQKKEGSDEYYYAVLDFVNRMEALAKLVNTGYIKLIPEFDPYFVNAKKFIQEGPLKTFANDGYFNNLIAWKETSGS